VVRLPAYARAELMGDQLSASCWYFSQSTSHWLDQSEVAALQNTPLPLMYPTVKISTVDSSTVEEVVWEGAGV